MTFPKTTKQKEWYDKGFNEGYKIGRTEKLTNRGTYELT